MYAPTDRTTASRSRDRMSYDEAAAHAVLDEAYDCALGFTVDGEPRVLPTLHVRVDDTLYLHGSTGSRPLLAARGDGLPVCVAVTLLDGLVYGRSQFHHSANYRSVVVHGTAQLVTDEREKARVMTALVEKAAPGRSTDSRPPSRRELAETAVLALPLREVSVRARTGGVREEETDLALPHWAGVVPLRLTAGLPEPDAGVTAPVPAYLHPETSPWLDPAVLRGEHVGLEPLDLSHADELHPATDDPEVWRHLGSPAPVDRAEMRAVIGAALAAHHRGERVPWVQRCAVTGAVVGTTSFYEVDPQRRTVAIGYTFLGRPWWRTGINTEAKLLLLTRAFEELDAVRVVWHTDIRNERSQRAIERLGASREGVLRRHRQRPDGSWRDTVQYSMTVDEWPNAQATLRERLRQAASVAS
ncbi:bifunctional pyridoxamine 5'-phosphate oxidase family protein/GNAT family N-acetyltransferase [Micromonospora peucetia]|uniref:Bifunctional pyridoxamine 5'-phosphate oxidase family protein/GNAT family N-acetyltransferase n=1 Tax=Micromonospora peucetia TaxID=47871 RepID=A0A1C6U3A6_9ACTN|nr:bifunctional pyridoxamine 5'-phosphate oxidase family protein/GNAT family N-acetyltransferase [Micromonospora peucetia]MCX4385997.1 bifunctional pyridoxamine 5'-phosphate oxidase family protein/GNAT family N-acetyltransferase [Micromonospora peucetia]WSA33365.1 bifunctional pyridoxamine 5'-phosphate oxidase family protein/GNAT family N-acetyltransferase [Micromonospora peucetia]SCL48526.1 Nitroimidazol reductase NimA, pyridoxamine 5'-phosphate oxidase superfamily [Micromonospora peucetia]